MKIKQKVSWEYERKRQTSNKKVWEKEREEKMGLEEKMKLIAVKS